PYLDECVAGYLGVHVWRGFAYPDPDGDEYALYAAPWFAQVGQALARLVGLLPLVRAHAGAAGWDETLPKGLSAGLAQLGWQEHVRQPTVHFLGDTMRPAPWIKLFYLAAGGAASAAQEWTLETLEALPWCEIPPGEESSEDAAMVESAL